MNLQETISLMRSKYDDIGFYAAISTMKRKANKGLLEGVSSIDIDNAVNTIENTNQYDNINSLIYETESAAKAYDNIVESNISDDDLEKHVISYYLTEANDDNQDDYSYTDYRRRTKRKWAAAGAAAAGAAGAAAAGYGLYRGGKKSYDTEKERYRAEHQAGYDTAAKNQQAEYETHMQNNQNAIDAELQKRGISAPDPTKTYVSDWGPANDKYNSEVASVKNDLGVIDPVDPGFRVDASGNVGKVVGKYENGKEVVNRVTAADVGEKAPSGISVWWKGFKERFGKGVHNVGDWWKNLSGDAKLGIGAGVGAAALGAGIGVYKLWKRRHEKKLAEEYTAFPDGYNNEYYFNNDTMSALADYVVSLPDEKVAAMYESDNACISDITKDTIKYIVDNVLAENKNTDNLYNYYMENARICLSEGFIKDAASKIKNGAVTAWNAVKNAAKTVGSAISAHKGIAIGATAGIAGLSAAAIAAHKHIQKRKNLTESYYFDDDKMCAISDYLLSLPDESVVALCESQNPVVSKITSNAIDYLKEITTPTVIESANDIPGDLTLEEILEGLIA